MAEDLNRRVAQLERDVQLLRAALASTLDWRTGNRSGVKKPMPVVVLLGQQRTRDLMERTP